MNTRLTRFGLAYGSSAPTAARSQGGPSSFDDSPILTAWHRGRALLVADVLAKMILARSAKVPTSDVSVPKEDANMGYLMLRISIALTVFLMADGIALASKIIGNG